MPKTKFSKGIHKGGKIMAKEYTGVLLIMASHSAFYLGMQAAEPKQDSLWPNAIARLDNAG
jgi:hypothetical protein